MGGWGGVFGRRRHLGIKLKQLFQPLGIVLEVGTASLAQGVTQGAIV
ncbi:hypothetical protein NTGBS_470004 [Candidatus Nitrotoga sp. BS]|nr:hypothetical protein NTGBS_470004 [Candidatus Nitrotoga sp. BS]